MPWSEYGPLLASSKHEDPAGYASVAVLIFAGPSLLFGALIAFAVNLDSRALQWLHFSLWALGPAWLEATLIIPRFGPNPPSWEGATPLAIGAAVMALAWLGFAFLRGLTLRIIGALVLICYALAAASGAFLLDQGHPDLWPTAYLPTLGWMICAISTITTRRQSCP
ncbi:hypothetical protein Lfu02_77610 [Longispora fulva]|uniref:Peptidoglycan/LPS O-acetylase OafA/YrhL n=1 Tax=Longispora fulva TaxID=619741 RepID=A0A8J7GCQ4_9ACTN|nr:hypothetical protein [Longispora fulva]MBG6136209.1 peptidoglycan/LPS O-acetylase OafA/YrhL [Longispora fulva]GIG63389.1 hypothetical protein Lfu02_77610 [Longispora fulva]